MQSMKNMLRNYSKGTSLLLGLAAFAVATTPSFAQVDTNTATMKPVVVTGSLIPTAETVGIAPVDTVSSQDIAKTGVQDVLAALKVLDPAFTGSGNLGQALNI